MMVITMLTLPCALLAAVRLLLSLCALRPGSYQQHLDCVHAYVVTAQGEADAAGAVGAGGGGLATAAFP